ncbi:MAG: hypothetical protein M3Z09_12405 [Acidobacteriota bacterium]|nr:hypothetical protein [Acidobacteriota bacterium]
MKTTLALSCLLVAAGIAPAATITGFTVTAVNGNGFTSVIGSSFDPVTARITQSTITCSSLNPCSGPVAQFTIVGTGLSFATPLSLDIDGSLTPPISLQSASGGSASIQAGGQGVISSASLPGPLTFSIPFGPFSESIAKGSLPGITGGNFSLSGTFGLSLAAGSVLNLPNSLTFTFGAPATATPEPGTAALLGSSWLGVVLAVRRRRA